METAYQVRPLFPCPHPLCKCKKNQVSAFNLKYPWHVKDDEKINLQYVAFGSFFLLVETRVKLRGNSTVRRDVLGTPIVANKFAMNAFEG
jgi:hypothetical protein